MWQSQHHANLKTVSVHQVLLRRMNSNDSLNTNQIRVDVKCVLSLDLWRCFIDNVFSSNNKIIRKSRRCIVLIIITKSQFSIKKL